jgi:cytochrome c
MMRLILLGVFALGSTFVSRAVDYDPSRFEREVLIAACNDPMQMDVARDGRVFLIERAGTLKCYDPATGAVTEIGRRGVQLAGEIGLLGLALDRDFARTQRLFLFFAPKEKENTLRLSRFTLKDGQLDLASERMLLDYPIERAGLNHQGGGLVMTRSGDLYLGTGDNTPPIPELQIDERPGRHEWDAQRTSANSMSLRGKILRIRPTEEGSYTTPPDNLFPDGKNGRPEIFAMGVRNAFRLSFDEATGTLYWGDVGQNISKGEGVGPNGYDEIHQARRAGNFGWPYFTGPNEAYRRYDFATATVGERYDVAAPRNDSPNNTGARELPRPEPALIWYPSTASAEFPMLGSGGRSAMSGPVYTFDPKVTSDLKLPEHFDRTLFIHDWMRNWIMAVKLDAQHKIARIEPFLPEMRFRKPIQVQLGADHTLYVLETGDKWSGNTDSQLVRLVYRRGNRAPRAVAAASVLAGKAPLRVRFDARKSVDKDGDALRYAWSFGSGSTSEVPAPEFIFTKPGVHPVTLTVSDSAGATSAAHLEVAVGNASPRVAFVKPANGSFYTEEQPVAYELSVSDEEDATIAPNRATVETVLRASSLASSNEVHPGLKLMQATTCFACHATTEKSVGPSYREVATRYRGDRAAREALAEKVLRGSAGIWGGDVPMPPHPQHTLEQTRLMVGWILSLAETGSPQVATGLRGTFKAPSASAGRRAALPVLALVASYTDGGVAELPSLRGTAEVVLHPRQKRAAAFDRAERVEVVDVFEGGVGNVARMSADGWFAIEPIELRAASSILVRASALVPGTTEFELRLGGPDGRVLGRGKVSSLDGAPSEFTEQAIALPEIGAGPHALFLVARHLTAPAGVRVLDVQRLTFEPVPPRPQS